MKIYRTDYIYREHKRMVVVVALFLATGIIGRQLWLPKQLPSAPEFTEHTDVVTLVSFECDDANVLGKSSPLIWKRGSKVKLTGKIARGIWGVSGVVPLWSHSGSEPGTNVMSSRSVDDKPLALFFVLDRKKQRENLTLTPKDMVQTRFTAEDCQQFQFQRDVIIDFSPGSHTCELWLLDLNEQVPINHRPPSAPPGTSVCEWEIAVQ